MLICNYTCNSTFISSEVTGLYAVILLTARSVSEYVSSLPANTVCYVVPEVPLLIVSAFVGHHTEAHTVYMVHGFHTHYTVAPNPQIHASVLNAVCTAYNSANGIAHHLHLYVAGADEQDPVAIDQQVA